MVLKNRLKTLYFLLFLTFLCSEILGSGSSLSLNPLYDSEATRKISLQRHDHKCPIIKNGRIEFGKCTGENPFSFIFKGGLKGKIFLASDQSKCVALDDWYSLLVKPAEKDNCKSFGIWENKVYFFHGETENAYYNVFSEFEPLLLKQAEEVPVPKVKKVDYFTNDREITSIEICLEKPQGYQTFSSLSLLLKNDFEEKIFDIQTGKGNYQSGSVTVSNEDFDILRRFKIAFMAKENKKVSLAFIQKSICQIECQSNRVCSQTKVFHRCTDCNGNSYFDEVQKDCIDCGDYKVLLGHRKCGPCKIGYHLDEKTNQCQKCGMNEIFNVWLGKCESCGKEKYAIRKNTIIECGTCSKPKTYNKEKMTCEMICFGNVICSEHQVCLKEKSKCDECDPNSVPYARQKNCVKCTKNSYPIEKGIKCGQCENNEYYDKIALRCVKCTNNSIPNKDKTKCESCEYGKFPIEESSRCGTCEPNYFGNRTTGSCEKCEKTSVSDGKARFCEKCNPPLYKVKEGTECKMIDLDRGVYDSVLFKYVACGPNEIKKDKNCVSCKGENYPIEKGKSCGKCKGKQVYKKEDFSCGPPCGKGMFLNGTEVCEDCPRGTVTNENFDSCEFCPKGLHSLDGNCLKCPEKTYVNESTKYQCVECPQGQEPSKSQDHCVKVYHSKVHVILMYGIPVSLIFLVLIIGALMRCKKRRENKNSVKKTAKMEDKKKKESEETVIKSEEIIMVG